MQVHLFLDSLSFVFIGTDQNKQFNCLESRMHVKARVTKFGVDRLVPISVNIQTRHGVSIVGKNDRFWNKNVSKRSMKAHSTSWVRSSKLLFTDCGTLP